MNEVAAASGIGKAFPRFAGPARGGFRGMREKDFAGSKKIITFATLIQRPEWRNR